MLWVSQKEAMETMVEKTSNRERLGTTNHRPSLFPKAHQECIIQFVTSLRQRELQVTTTMVLANLISSFPEFYNRELGTSLTRKTLVRRIWRVLRRNGICKRRTTHQAQSTRQSEEMLVDWVKYVNMIREMYDIPLENIANFDETNIYFAPASSTTLNEVGARTISVRGADSSQRATVMLGVARDGYKFDPYLIFLGSRGPAGRVIREVRLANAAHENLVREELDEHGDYKGYSSHCIYDVQENGWMDEELMQTWITEVWKPFADSKTGKTLLILDEFRGHMTTAVRNAIADCDTVLVIIPGGCTNKLQVMDVGLNKPFKDRMRDCYHQWFVDQVMIDEANNYAKPSRQNISQWVWTAWNGLTYSTIYNTWVHIFGVNFSGVGENLVNPPPDNDDPLPNEEQDDDDDDHVILM
jgi:hypothetical protein